MRVIVFWSFTAACFAFAFTSLGGRFAILIQPQMMLMVLLPTLICLLAQYPPRDWAAAGTRFLRQQITDHDQRCIHNTVLIGMIFGALGAAAGVIHSLSHATAPEAIGIGVAMAIVSFIYGLLPAAILMPITRRPDQNQQTPQNVVPLKRVGS
jgi:flagellar motor component MotA